MASSSTIISLSSSELFRVNSTFSASASCALAINSASIGGRVEYMRITQVFDGVRLERHLQFLSSGHGFNYACFRETTLIRSPINLAKSGGKAFPIILAMGPIPVPINS